MEINVFVALVLSIYGALLSTTLLVLKWKEGRREITTVIEHTYYIETSHITFINTGRRPVTIQDMRLEVLKKFDPNVCEVWYRIPTSSIFVTSPEEVIFPQKLTDGESKKFQCSGIATDLLLECRLSAQVKVYDAEGNIHQKLVCRFHNPRQDIYEVVKIRKQKPILWIRFNYLWTQFKLKRKGGIW